MVYGDTDSVMVYSATDDLASARKMADGLKREVNKHYRCMEIDIDGVMKSLLLLKKKKSAKSQKHACFRIACRSVLASLP